METATELKIDELDWYINGLQNDLRAVKNAIIYPYNNGLAEGSVNKIKLTKRIMYGRCFIESKTTHKRIFSSNQLNLERTYWALTDYLHRMQWGYEFEINRI